MLLAACSSTASTAYSTSELMETVTGSVEFPPTVEETDLSAVGIDGEYVGEFTIIRQMLSVDVVEVIIAKPADGKESVLIEALRGRKDELINIYAFYPGQKESAEATVVGSSNGVCYLICHSDASTAEKALLEKLNS